MRKPVPEIVACDKITTTRFSEENEQRVVHLLLDHQCEICLFPVSCIIFFPPGTTKQEIYPRVGQSRYTIILPDGMEMMEMCSPTGISELGFNPEDLVGESDR